MDDWLPTLAQPGLAVLAAMLAAGWIAAWHSGGALCGPARATCRIAAAALVFQWLAVGLFNALAGTGMFNWWMGLAAWAVAAAVAWRFSHTGATRDANDPVEGRHARLDRQAFDDPRRALRLDLRHALHSAEGWIALVGFSAIAVRAVRSLAAPQLNVDALQYQLLNPARWVQAGGFVRDDAPGAWGFYHHFPGGGNVLWAWFMLPSHSDAYAGIAGVLVWGALLAGLYALARELGGPRRMSAVIACAIAFSPAVATAVTSGYVDNILLADFVFAALFVARFAARGRPGDLLLAAAALGLGAGVKTTGIPIMILGAGVLVALSVVRRARVRIAPAVWTAAAAAAAVPLAGYLHTWIEKGSPFYPMAVTLFGREVLPGNEEFFLLCSGALFGDLPFSLPHFLALLFVSPVPVLDGAHVNWGPGAIVILALGVASIGGALRVRGLRAALVFALGAAAVTVAGFATRTMHSQLTAYAIIAGRLITVTLTGVGVWAVLAPGRAARVMAALALAAGVAYSLPFGMRVLDVPAIGWVLIALTPCIACAGVLIWLRPRGGWVAFALTCVAVLTVLTATDAAIHHTRSFYRYRHYELASKTGDTVYDMRPLWHRIAGLHSIWRQVDGAVPLRIAATEGWGGQTSMLGLRYPLLGSRLQNTIVYVPPAKSGEVIDHRLEAELRAAADYGAWRTRLRERGVDVAVSFYPDTIELGWMRGHPEDFEPVARSLDGYSHAFRVRDGGAPTEPAK